MFVALLLGVAIVSASPVDPSPGATSAAYHEAAAKAGRDPDVHVRLALWCEARGLTAGRTKHLVLAVLNDPNHATARGLLGFVHSSSGWKRAEVVAAHAGRDDAEARALAAYRERRAVANRDVQGQRDLAVWCERQGLSSEARAHWSAVTRLEPTRRDAWERLGYVLRGDSWVPREQADAEDAKAQARARADQAWAGRLRAWQEAVRDSSPSHRQEAVSAMARLDDPTVVFPLQASLSWATADWHQVAVSVFDRFHTPEATEALVALAVEGKTDAVCGVAVAALKKRDVLEYGGKLTGMLRFPLVYTVEPVQEFGSDGRLIVDWGDAIEKRTYHTPAPMPLLPPPPPNSVLIPDGRNRPVLRSFTQTQVGETFGFDGKRMRRYKVYDVTATDVPIGQMWDDRVRALRAARARQEKDVETVRRRNKVVLRTNELVAGVLKTISGKAFGADDISAWQAWWSEEEGYRYQRPDTVPKPVIQTEVAVRPYERARPRTFGVGTNYVVRASCFAQGTPVWTIEGKRPVESIEVGDMVLAEDPVACTLSYQPVVMANHNAPAATIRLRLDNGDGFICTGIHRLWLPGKGWVKARDLKPGDILRTLNGPVRVSAIESETTQPVFNLGLGGTYGLLVGETGVLAHDDSPVRPIPTLFDDGVAGSSEHHAPASPSAKE